MDAITVVEETTAAIETTIKDRLRAVFEELIEVAEINPMLIKLGAAFFENMMNNSDEEMLKSTLVMLKDEMLPFILGEDDKDKA